MHSVLLTVLVEIVVHNAHDEEDDGVVDFAHAGHLVRHGLRGEEVLRLEEDAAGVEEILVRRSQDFRSQRECLLAVLHDEAEVRVGLCELDRDCANAAADVDDN